MSDIQAIARSMVTKHKGILAADESNGSANKRFVAANIEVSEENRRRWRELLLTTPNAEKYLNGVILYDETIRQSTSDGQSFADYLTEKGIMPGIKVDMGTRELPNFEPETYTQGLDDLAKRLEEYKQMGAKFTKWRSVVRIDGSKLPTPEAVFANAVGLAHYAAIVQQAGMVPMIEPEVLYDGEHDIDRCEQVVTEALSTVVYQLERYRVDLSAIIVKTSMVLAGKGSGTESTPEEVSQATMRALRMSVPESVPGVVFLSGGQSPDQAAANFNAIAKLEPSPWELAFSFSRALQETVMNAWKGEDGNKEAAQEEFQKRLKIAVAADEGDYAESMEKA